MICCVKRFSIKFRLEGVFFYSDCKCWFLSRYLSWHLAEKSTQNCNLGEKSLFLPFKYWYLPSKYRCLAQVSWHLDRLMGRMEDGLPLLFSMSRSHRAMSQYLSWYLDRLMSRYLESISSRCVNTWSVDSSIDSTIDTRSTQD